MKVKLAVLYLTLQNSNIGVQVIMTYGCLMMKNGWSSYVHQSYSFK